MQEAPRAFSFIRQQIQQGQFTVPQLVEFYLSRIAANPGLNIFLEVWEGEARQQALVIQQKIENGDAGRLAGMVIGLKDNICYKDHKVSASSKILEGFTSLYSATVVERLLAEDALFIGRLNCDEFAMGSSNENSAYGTVRNPLNPSRVPGGSSGGSAAAVAANMCNVALGSDTGGSIRQPASFCGLVGIKPTYGRVSRHGLIAYASTMDQIGPLANNIDDAALVLEVISGHDEFDNTASSRPVAPYTKVAASTGRLKFSYLTACFERDGIDEEVKQAHLAFFDRLRAEGHQVMAVDFPYLDYLVPTYNVLSNAEASSNLSRFDGMRYGYRSQRATDLHSTYTLSRTEGFGREVKRRIMLGTFVLSAGFYDAYYARAQKARRLIRDYTRKLFVDCDFILTPTTPHPAFEFGARGSDPVAMYLEDIFTVQANLAGVPAASYPIFKHSNGMPFGIQAMAPDFEEEKLVCLGKMSLFQTREISN
jgi:aspartyl-tRNA(Asn)/glutamyl-tRNA(Gln) amidotransferase subunit A